MSLHEYNGDVISDEEWDQADRENLERHIEEDETDNLEVDLREEVKWFAEQMEEVLEGNVMKRLTKESIKPIVEQKEKEMRCNCDLDNWQPDTRTGHSWVCRIHKAAIAEWNGINRS